MMKSVLFSILVAGVTLAAQTPAVELKVGDAAPDFTLPATRRPDLQARRTSAASRPSCSPGSRRRSRKAARLSASRSRSTAISFQKYNVDYFMVERRSARAGTKPSPRRTTPTSRCSRDPDKTTANATACWASGPVANRWTFYIGKDGKILAIDKMVKPATSAEDMAAKLGELNVAKK